MICVFCERIADRAFEDTDSPGVVTFIPLNPVSEGHRLFVSVEHVEHAADDPVTFAMTAMVAATWARKNPGDYNIITSIGSDATQTVKHLHVHLVPRYTNDGLHLPWTPPYEEPYIELN